MNEEEGGLTSDPNILELVEETASISKRRITTGQVEIRTVTDSFEEAVHAELLREGAVVTRIPFGTEVTVVPRIRTEGDVTIVPVLEEILVVEKRLVLREEIHITRTSDTDAFHSEVTLRRQRAVVERQDAAGRSRPAEPPERQDKETS